MRVEHVQQLRYAEEFKLKKKKNDELKAAAKDRGETINTKRQAKGSKPGFMLEGMTLETHSHSLLCRQRSQGWIHGRWKQTYQFDLLVTLGFICSSRFLLYV
ncbi:hypothetical protein AALP_AA6G339500 [Arabis alpina]|uniref:Uncharacterized protein n=1 Tax=Arabis alpina TaxID=50452 RepID=A0A087GTG8_ARAAL|nr:hypothetical protein AALP_AA6G339500 [Arabis alpina]